MKICLNTRYASGPLNVPAGTILDLDEAEARALVAGGYAVAVSGAPKEPTLEPESPPDAGVSVSKPMRRRSSKPESPE